MSNRLTNPNIQFLDNQGLILNGGFLYTYVTGTSTLATTYNNADLAPGHARTNPIELDSAGRAGDVFLDPTVTYKLVLKDADLTTIWTADPVVDLAANINAKVQIYAGNPNGNVAGNAGTVGGVGASMVWDTTNRILYICTTTGNAAAAVWTSISAKFTGAESIHTTDYTVLAADNGIVQVANKASAITFSLTSVATLGAGFLLPAKNIGGGTLTLDPAGAETIDGSATLDLTVNQGALLYCNGSTWRVLANYNSTAGTISGTSLTLTSTDAGAGAGPTITLDRNSASPAASDLIGQLLLSGRDSGAGTDTYADIIGKILDPTAASEDAAILLRAAIAGALTAILTIGPGVQIGSPTGGDKGAGTLNAENGVYEKGFRTGRVLLTSGTVAAAATLDLPLTSYTAYRAIKIELTTFVPATDGATLDVRLSTDGGATYDSGASNYSYAGLMFQDGAGAIAESSTGDTLIPIAINVGNGAAEGVSCSLDLPHQTSTALWPTIRSECTYISADATPRVTRQIVSGARRAAQDTDAIRFLFSSGNITSGTYAVYGYL